MSESGSGWKMESLSASTAQRRFFSYISQGFCFVCSNVSFPYWLGISNFPMPCLCYYCPCPFHRLLIFQQLSGWAPDGFLSSKISNTPKSCSRYPKHLGPICGYGHLLSDPTSTGRILTLHCWATWAKMALKLFSEAMLVKTSHGQSLALGASRWLLREGEVQRPQSGLRNPLNLFPLTLSFKHDIFHGGFYSTICLWPPAFCVKSFLIRNGPTSLGSSYFPSLIKLSINAHPKLKDSITIFLLLLLDMPSFPEVSQNGGWMWMKSRTTLCSCYSNTP